MLGLSDVWLAFFRGSLRDMARFVLWFSSICGSLIFMVLLRFWLAGFDGSLSFVARSIAWVSPPTGSLFKLVLSPFTRVLPLDCGECSQPWNKGGVIPEAGTLLAESCLGAYHCPFLLHFSPISRFASLH